ncbi:MAG: hypothetical protein KGL02_12810, partial [Acidobacteriota bacterium]|nr:hypothetical protein [Acidobacteriota bacterium]
ILTLQFRNGQKQAYWRFGRGELKKAVSLIDVLGPHGSGELTAVGGMVSLCPGCFAVLSPRVYQCSGCGLQFKDEGNLLRRGLLVPGGATFYVGATGLGAMRALSECILAAACVLIVLPIVFAGPEHRNVAGALLGGGFFLLLLAFDKTIAIVFSRQQVRDFLPAKTNRT